MRRPRATTAADVVEALGSGRESEICHPVRRHGLSETGGRVAYFLGIGALRKSLGLAGDRDIDLGAHLQRGRQHLLGVADADGADDIGAFSGEDAGAICCGCAVLCGFLADGFTFVGFPPSRSIDRKRWFLNLADEPRPLVLFEAPHRIQQSLTESLNILGDRPIFVGRELTKLHEQQLHGTISEVIGQISNKKGEFTIIIDSAEPALPPSTLPEGNALWKEFCQLTDNYDLSRRQLVAKLARRYGIQGRQMYEALEKSRRPTIQDQD